MVKKYIPAEVEAKWQKKWEEAGIYRTADSSDKPKKYILDMFPYPSGDGLHVGHFKGYVATDILSRYFRFRGFNVFHPMGWDAFGLPAENYAIKMGIHPSITTAKNITNIKKQMKMVGLSYDWDREINTTDPAYYKWTQWIFIKLFEKGLAYEDDAPINWCPADKTGLANEEVIDGKCARCGTKVEIKKIRQWILGITKYADRLLEDLEGLDWPEFIKEMQVNWIGRSEGVNFKEKVKDLGIEFEVYDSVPQTFIAQTFTVIAPEHPMVEQLIAGTEYEKPVREFIEKIKEKKAAKKFDVEKEMEGIFTGRYVENPFGTGDLPIWVASYVIYEYGTGIVNCSAHDERDFDFAKKYGIPLRAVMFPEDKEMAEKVKNLEVCYHHAPEGIIQEPTEFSGMKWVNAREPIIEYIEKQGLGKRQVHYHLRDWIFSRQRYWGEPIPIVHCEKCGVVAVPEDQLPLKLPEVKKYEPTGTGESPLAAISDWVNTKCPKCGGPAKRETNTMPQWAGSCWYYIAYTVRKNSKFEIMHSQGLKSRNSKLIDYWLPVDWYIGGAEHAVLHLLYARFWHKVLFDIGIVSTREPFQKLSSVGLVLAEDGRKMSKSLGNVVTPDDIVGEYGADALRLYEAFMGPFENTISWDPTSINGVYKFLQRVWQLSEKVAGSSGNRGIRSLGKDKPGNQVTWKPENLSGEDLRMMHKTIKKVTEDIENIKFNTAVAALMEWLNYLSAKAHESKALSGSGDEAGIGNREELNGYEAGNQTVPGEARIVEGQAVTLEHDSRQTLNETGVATDKRVTLYEYETLLKLLAPFAPHIAEELWSGLSGIQAIRSSGKTKPDNQTTRQPDNLWSIHNQPWPVYDAKLAAAKKITLVVQVNGKLRDRLPVEAGISQQEAKKLALRLHSVLKYLGNEKPGKIIFIPDRLINIVI